MSICSKVDWNWCKIKKYFSFNSFLCECALDPNERPSLTDLVYQYQAATNALVDSGAYDTREDFTVVRQPFMEHMSVPQTVKNQWEKNREKTLLFVF